MQGRPLILCCWPGLARLWLRGEWSSLFVAAGFSLLLNLALVSSFVWPTLLDETFPRIAWPMVVFVWITSAGLSYRLLGQDRFQSPAVVDPEVPPDEDALFIQAQNQYLKGDWKQAEDLLLERLESHARDIEARLLWATILRRTGRIEKAIEQLNILGRFDASLPWQFEINCERKLIEQTRDELQAAETQTQVSDESLPDRSGSPPSGTVRLGESSSSPESLSPDQTTVDLPVGSTPRRAA